MNEVPVKQQGSSLKPLYAVWNLPNRTGGAEEVLEERCLDSVLVDQ